MTTTSPSRGSRGFAASQQCLFGAPVASASTRAHPPVASMSAANSPAAITSSGGTPRDDRPTPQATFDALNIEFTFTLDAAASSKNRKCARYFDAQSNGLKQSWAGETVWLNPPHGRPLPLWFAKAQREAASHGATVVMLVPASTDTHWWHDAMNGASEVRFIRGRLAFGNSTGKPAPFGSALIIYRPGTPPKTPRTTYGHPRH